MNVKNILMSVILLSVSATAMAYPKHDPNVYDGGNLWTITFYNDNSVNHDQWATQRICFLPYTSPAANQTHIAGRWYSTTYPNWNGVYQQEGDSVKMLGNFWKGDGNDTITVDIVSDGPVVNNKDARDNLAAGHWHEWTDNYVYRFFGNTLLQRVGKCHSPKSIDDLSIEPRMLKNGREAIYPLQRDQIKLEGANQFEELFK